MTSSGGVKVACPDDPQSHGCCVIIAPLLAKAGDVVIPVAADETEAQQPAPVLACKSLGRLAKAVKEAWSVSLGVVFPITPPMSTYAARGAVRSILGLAFPMILTGLLLYLWSMISMLFLGRLSGMALAGGSLAFGFANITGYSVLSGLAMGMEPICGLAFGAGNYSLLGVTMQRTVLLLVAAAVPIGGLWVAATTPFPRNQAPHDPSKQPSKSMANAAIETIIFGLCTAISTLHLSSFLNSGPPTGGARAQQLDATLQVLLPAAPTVGFFVAVSLLYAHIICTGVHAGTNRRIPEAIIFTLCAAVGIIELLLLVLSGCTDGGHATPIDASFQMLLPAAATVTFFLTMALVYAHLRAGAGAGNEPIPEVVERLTKMTLGAAVVTAMLSLMIVILTFGSGRIA